MRRLLGQKLKPLILGSLLALTMSLVPAGQVFAACTDVSPCKPYFKVFGSDAFAGGWFTKNGTCDTSPNSNYQDPQKPPASNLLGGILAYTVPPSIILPFGGVRGASSQYGAFALGNVEDGGSSKGFYSNGATSGGVTKPSTLTFANDINAPWGGIFQGNIRQSHCMPDYYSKNPLTVPNFNGLTNATVSDIYYAQPAAGNLSLDGDENPQPGTDAPVTIAAGADITIYVNGSVYIRNNITYAASYNESSVPKFTLVARGNIYVDYRVKQLDGLYIAQPGDSDVPTSNSGIIWTCHPDSQTNDLQYIFISANCGNKLTFDGAVVAKQVNFTRTPGDVAQPVTLEDTNCGNAVKVGDFNNAACSNIAEIINYSPAMVIGGGFFNPPNTSSLDVESLLSLPPTL